MKRRRFSVEQIVAILKQAEMGMPVAELIRRVGISEQTFYRCGTRRTGNPPPDGVVRASPVFSQHVLQHCTVHRQLRHQLLQPPILILELLELTYLIDFQPVNCFFPIILNFRGVQLVDRGGRARIYYRPHNQQEWLPPRLENHSREPAGAEGWPGVGKYNIRTVRIAEGHEL